MANDNQTALMMSIQRKRDEIKRIEHKIYLAKWDNSFHPTREEYAKLSVLPDEITEDEKLLPVDKQLMVKASVWGISKGVMLQSNHGPSINELAKYKILGTEQYNLTYGTKNNEG